MKPPTLRIRADGTISEPADQARVRLEFSVVRVGQREAIEELEKEIQGLHEAMTGASLDPSALRTSGRSIEPEHEEVGRRKRQIGFRAEETVEITFPVGDSRLGAFLQCLSESPATPELRISYDLAKPEGLVERAFTAAVENARRGALALATAGGCQLGALLRIESESSEPYWMHGGFASTFESAPPMNKRPALTPHSISVTRSVTVTWQLQKGA